MKKIPALFEFIHPAELFLVCMLGVFGILALWWLPISAGYDEETHFVRVWQMSNLDMLPNKVNEAEIPFPTIYWDLSYRRQFIVRAIEPDFWDKYGKLPIDAYDYTYGVETRSVYSPLLLLPHAITVRYAGRSLGLPALPVFYLTRLTGLLAYILLTWFAVRLIPFGKWTLAVLAVSPMALLQAVTVSADTISNGIAFFFIAAVLLIAQKNTIDNKTWWGLIFLAILLFAAKVNLAYLILLPLILLPPARFRSKKSYALFLGAICALFLIEVLGWSIVAYPRLATPPDGTDPLGQVKFILTNFLSFNQILVNDIVAHAGVYFKNWIALYGYNYWPVPEPTYFLYGIALFTSLFIGREKIIPDKKQRIVFLSLFVVGYIATIILMYISFTPVGNSAVIGVQGRYFTVAMPLLFLSLIGIRQPSPVFLQSLKRIFIFTATLSLIIYTIGLWLSYHVPCGSQYYQSGFCYQPKYKNFAPAENYLPPLSSEITLTQEFIPECNRMTSIRVWVDAADDTAQTQLTIIVTDPVGHLVAKESAGNMELPHSGWYTFLFTPENESLGSAYQLTLQGDGVKIAASIRPEYPQAKLYLNGEPSDQDVIFQYGCVAGWKK